MKERSIRLDGEEWIGGCVCMQVEVRGLVSPWVIYWHLLFAVKVH